MEKLKTTFFGKAVDKLQSYKAELLEKVDLPDYLEAAVGLSDEEKDLTQEDDLQDDDFLSEEKTVDFVLVTIVGVGDEEVQKENERKRRCFEKNLHDQGLLLQHVKPTMKKQECAGYAEGLTFAISFGKAVKERNFKGLAKGVKNMLSKAVKPLAKEYIEMAKDATGLDNQLPMEGDDSKQDNKEPQTVFTLIHAPWEPLAKCAETMMLRVPIREPDEEKKSSRNRDLLWKAGNVFKIDKPSALEKKRHINAFFKRNQMSMYLFQDHKETFFDPVDRNRLVYRLLKSAYYSTEPEDFGIRRLLNENIYDDAYSLHHGDVDMFLSPDEPARNDRQRLVNDWASFRRWYKFQPLNAIKSYFGSRVAMYFAWLGTYTMMLTSAAIVGLICFVIGFLTIDSFIPAQDICSKNNSRLFYMCPLCDKNCSFWSLTTSCQYARYSHAFDYQGTVFFAVFMSFWSVIFLEVWKRQQISLAYEWDMMNFEEDFEPPRPTFVATVKERRPNPVTGIMEPYIPWRVRTGRYVVASAAITMMILLVLASVFGVVIYRAILLGVLSTIKNLPGSSRIYTSLTSAVLNLLSIAVLSKVYSKLAFALTNWENPRTMTEYQNILTIKMFLFQAVNMYSSFFYIAFFKTSFVTGIPGHFRRIAGVRMEGCDPSGCLMELCIQLAVLLGGKQFKSQIQEIMIPSIKRWWNHKFRSKMEDVFSMNKQETPLPQWEQDYLLLEEPEFRMFEEYLEMVLQFGLVTMFVAAFPLAPLLALLNNILELRSDAINFVVNYRRPVAQRAQDIGAWLTVLSSICTAAIILNSLVIAFTSEFIPSQVYKYAFSPDGSLRGYMNNSLSYFNVEDLEAVSLPSNPFKNLPYNMTYCRFKEYVSPYPPYRFTLQYYYVLAARLAFVVVFNGVVFSIVKLLAWLIPDVPYSLDIKIKREEYLARVSLLQSEMEI